MALFTPSQSPAVVVKEIDLTGGVPNVQTSTGAIVGKFRWGPVRERTLVSNEANLIDTFSTPDTTNNIDFHAASYFLRYSQSLYVVREASTAAKNAQVIGIIGASTAPIQIRNKTHFDVLSFDSGEAYLARFPGDLGNSLQVQYCVQDSASAGFASWSLASAFDAAPTTSVFDSDRNGVNTGIHLAVVDEDGLFTGTKGQVLEAYPFLSLASNSKNEDGSTAYFKDVINERSNFIYVTNQFDSDLTSANAGAALTPGTEIIFNVGTNQKAKSFTGGIDSAALGTTEFLNGFDLFEDTEQVEVDFLIAPGMTTSVDQGTIVNDLVSTAQSLRKDCIVVTSPARNDVVGFTNATLLTNAITETMNDFFTKSSYLVVDGNYLKVYDKFNDQYIQIPAASSTAGLMAETDRNAAPWFSPAGARRGQYLGVTSIDYNPNKSQRDTLYKAGVNPITNIAGGGVTLFGDKTALKRPSAFDRINVRRLFLVLERAIGRAAQNVLFEFNDEFTRAEFVNVIEPVLRDVKGRRGITDFRIVADETVNTPAVIDRNEFIANIFIKPARSINYVTLNFVAVRTGVDFEEVVGTV
jgi:phage tail sheath protein FI